MYVCVGVKIEYPTAAGNRCLERVWACYDAETIVLLIDPVIDS